MIVTTSTRSKRKKISKKDKQLAAEWQQKMTEWASVKKFCSAKAESNRTVSVVVTKQYIRESEPVRSRVTAGGDTAKRAGGKYTGTKMIGIAAMHKSNLVPVFAKDNAEDISKMRR